MPMSQSDKRIYKVASEAWEFEQIHNLNYRTFVEEIPQHTGNQERQLTDKFHQQNTYVICLEGKKLLGMIAIHDQRPFSLDAKLPDLDRYLPPAQRMCEIRLLAIEKGYRHNSIFPGLLTRLARYAEEQGYDLGLISGTVRQTKLYHHIGFSPFGPLVGTEDAQYQPMYLTFSAYRKLKEQSRIFRLPTAQNGNITNLLPGPVTVNRAVLRVLGRPPHSHRANTFHELFSQTRQLLCQRLNAKQVQIAMGSGTLANDMVAAQLALTQQPGLVLVNGEFGRRLADHASRHGLHFDTLCVDEGEVFSQQQLLARLDEVPGIGWLWATHCETSTGVVNDLAMLSAVCREQGIRLCLDCISSIGTLPIDLEGVYLAAGVSGKAIGSLPGLALVFHQSAVRPRPDALPRYLDLGLYAESDGIPFTISSNQLEALHTALTTRDWSDYFAALEQWSTRMRGMLKRLGLSVLTPAEHSSPAVLSVGLPPHIDSLQLGEYLERNGIHLSYRSGYLVDSNRIQLCMMGEIDEDVASLEGAMRTALEHCTGTGVTQNTTAG